MKAFAHLDQKQWGRPLMNILNSQNEAVLISSRPIFNINFVPKVISFAFKKFCSQDDSLWLALFAEVEKKNWVGFCMGTDNKLPNYFFKNITVTKLLRHGFARHKAPWYIVTSEILLTFATLWVRVCTTGCIFNELPLLEVMLRLSMSSQVKPAPPLCGTTRPGAMSMETGRIQSPRSWHRTSSTQFSRVQKSSSCSETRQRGRQIYLHICVYGYRCDF